MLLGRPGDAGGFVEQLLAIPHTSSGKVVLHRGLGQSLGFAPDILAPEFLQFSIADRRVSDDRRTITRVAFGASLRDAKTWEPPDAMLDISHVGLIFPKYAIAFAARMEANGVAGVLAGQRRTPHRRAVKRCIWFFTNLMRGPIMEGVSNAQNSPCTIDIVRHDRMSHIRTASG